MAQDDAPESGAVRTPKRGRNLDDLRRANLATVLELVHLTGALSRAAVTRATGLNRSTVATIVNELEGLGLVVVSEPLETKRIGRPSTMIAPSDRYLAVAANPEVDAVTIGLVALGGRVIRTVRFENDRTPTPREVVDVIAAALSGMVSSDDAGARIVGIGLAVPGLVRAADGLVRLAPHLEWVDSTLVQMLGEATGLPVFAGNDASIGVMAEVAFGAGVGQQNVVYLNGGASGVGGGVIVGGAHLGGAQGYGGELGHTLVNSGGRLCHCGAIGCLETEVVRSELMDALGVGDPADLEERMSTAVATDADVRAIVERQVDFLATALRNVVNALNPSMVILGGFLATLHRVASDRLEEAVRRTALPGAGTDVVIVASQLGRDNLLIGAAELAFAGVIADPATVAIDGDRRSFDVVAAV